VKLGVTEGENVAVLEGVRAGERVVLEGLDRLRDGRDVEIIADQAAADPPVAEPPVAAK
jgi:multidrug efflux system membrane fusion protein